MLLALGASLIVDSVLRGHANAAIVIVFPVLSGTSPEFLVGALLLFVGLLTAPLLAIGALVEPASADGPDSTSEPARACGGVILIGPVPIFFGGWRRATRRTYWWWVAAATLFFLVVLVAWVWWVRSG